MRLQLDILLTLFRTELRMLFRDRRILVMSIGIPVLIMPLLFFGSRVTLKQREQKLQQMTCSYAVDGSQAQAVRDLMTATTARLERETGRTNKPGLRAVEVPCSDPLAALNRNDIQVILKGLTPDEYRATQATNRAAARREENRKEDEKIGARLVVELVGRADRDDSMACVNRITDALEETRLQQRTGLLRAAGFQIAPEQAGAVTEVDLASKRQVAGLALGRFLTALLLVFILSGGAVAAIDSLAGEKERGTLETLLTTGASRLEIIAAKLLTVLALAFLITAIQSANLLVYIGFKLIPVPAHFAAAISPGVALLLLLLYFPLAAFAAGVLLLVSGNAKTYKEAQMLFFPIFLVGLAPALAPMFPGLPLQSAVVLLPVAGLAVAARDILIGSYNWPMILLAWLSTATAAAWTAWIAVRHLSAERLITAADTEAADLSGGPALFRRHVLRWFAVLWGALLIINNYMTEADVRLQLLVNLVGIFFLGSVLMMRWYRLKPREALALRVPRPAVWFGVLLAVPGGGLTAVGLFKLANLFIPVPPEMLESFSEGITGSGVPVWQLMFFLTVMPGFFEEITFRGVLMHGLRDRMHPAALALVVGVVFGIFHVALFRFVPTACLGVMLAAVVLLTGSIYPAMVWHALSNGVSVLASSYDIPITELEPGSYLVGLGLLVTGFWIIYRNRTPYPGLRPWRFKAESTPDNIGGSTNSHWDR